MTAQRVSILISDPWDLGESLGWRALPGVLVTTRNDGQGGRALIQLDNTISYKGSAYRYVVASPRHQGREISDLKDHKKVDATLTGIADNQAHSRDALNTSNWRGGLAFIGEIEPVADDRDR
jgi:hypothetical protein